MMKDGKKTVAEKAFYGSFDVLEKEGDPVQIFETAINNIGPKTEVKARRVGGASYQVPLEVRGDRRSNFGNQMDFGSSQGQVKQGLSYFFGKISSGNFRCLKKRRRRGIRKEIMFFAWQRQIKHFPISDSKFSSNIVKF